MRASSLCHFIALRSFTTNMFSTALLLLTFPFALGLFVSSPIDTIQGLISRTLGTDYVSKFDLTIEEKPFSFYQVYAAKNNKIGLLGSNGVALASAFQYYLQYYMHFQVKTWSGSSINRYTPSTLPQISADVVYTANSTLKYSYYLNVVAYSYTTVFWNWDRWEQEIDWMALNGINLPLAFTGQEKIWQKVWTLLGVAEDDILNYFGGPAFLAFQRMGNIKGWAGPMPQTYIDAQAELQVKILNRMRSYGMTPALPAFNGHVPDVLSSLFPEANITKSPVWANMPTKYCCTSLLEPTDPLYV